MDAHLATSSPGAPSKLIIGKNISVGTQQLQKRFGPLTSLDTDLLNVASVIYAADLAVKRNEREDFVRTIDLKLPVINLAAFNGVKTELEHILRVLSCDNWTLHFEADVGTPEPNRK